MDDKKYINLLEAALVELLDGQSRWYEIRDQTGCSEERSKDIEELYRKVVLPSQLSKR